MKQEMKSATEQVHFGNDSVVIHKFISDISGGKTLDVSGITDTIIKAGHIIITDGNGTYKPMPVNGDAYASLPEGFSYVGVLYRTILTSKPAASIMTNGEVNEVASPYSVEAIKAALKSALPHIVFVKDEEA